ncbi:MAG: hydrogenase expression protein HypE [Actinomycetota bacterium]|nr:hydrogenase expression protein HypE [Actinomycetota bacterium]
MTRDGGRAKRGTRAGTKADRGGGGPAPAQAGPSPAGAAMPAWGQDPQNPLAPVGVRSGGRSEAPDPHRLGDLSKAYLIWLAGASCDGCSVAMTGGTHPRVEHLLAGLVPGLPRLELVHTVLSTESGPEWVHNLFMAERGELDAPYVITWEGSVMDESIAGDGYWRGLGEDPQTGRQFTSLEWLARLAPGAAAVFAIGTCATWGGIPAAKGSPTDAMGVREHLGKDYRSASGLPVVNVPGCAPIGDNYLEAVAATLLFLNGLAPPPELDELGRPAWLWGQTLHRHCPRAGYYEEGVFAKEYGDEECLVELGCWGPVVECNIADRGVVDGRGGCMQMGGICIGCTMPGFPDRFSPVYAAPPASLLVPATSRVAGGFLRRVRAINRRNEDGAALRGGDASSGRARSRTVWRRPVTSIPRFSPERRRGHQPGAAPVGQVAGSTRTSVPVAGRPNRSAALPPRRKSS